MIAYHATYYDISQNLPYIGPSKKKLVCSNTVKSVKSIFGDTLYLFSAWLVGHKLEDYLEQHKQRRFSKWL